VLQSRGAVTDFAGHLRQTRVLLSRNVNTSRGGTDPYPHPPNVTRFAGGDGARATCKNERMRDLPIAITRKQSTQRRSSIVEI
jgi:hypothetical protein